MPRRNNQKTVVFLNPSTCGVYKNGKPRFKVDIETGRRSSEIDNDMMLHVEAYINGERPLGMAEIPLSVCERNRVIVPRFYDPRYETDFDALVQNLDCATITLGDLVDSGVIYLRGGHGSPSNDQRVGHVPYIKVSDIRHLRININPTNLVPLALAERFWGAQHSGIYPWDLVTPNRASGNIGEFAIVLPGEEQVVITKEVFIITVSPNASDTGWTPFYLLWNFCLAAIRRQWQRVTLMQTNREDVSGRYRQIRLISPPTKEWADKKSAAFRDYFISLAEAGERFMRAVENDDHQYIASVRGELIINDFDEPEFLSADENQDNVDPIV